MKKITLLNCLFALLFIACENENNPCDPESFSAKLIPNKEIVVEFNTEFNRNNFTLTEGNKLVFEYIHGRGQCDNIIDDEWAEILTFQIDNNLSSFRFENDEMLSTHAFYRQIGAFVVSIPYGVSSGVITGEKIANNRWLVTVDIEVELTDMNSIIQQVQFTEIFRN